MKERSSKELEQLKHLSLKIDKAPTKNVAITEKNNMSGKSYVPTMGICIYLQKLSLMLTLQMNQSFNMFQLLGRFLLIIAYKW